MVRWFAASGVRMVPSKRPSASACDPQVGRSEPWRCSREVVSMGLSLNGYGIGEETVLKMMVTVRMMVVAAPTVRRLAG